MHVALTRRRHRRGMHIVDTRPSPIEAGYRSARRTVDGVIATVCLIGLVWIAADALATVVAAWGAR